MNESIVKTIGVAFAVCLICSLVVSASAVSLRDLQKENKLNDKRIKILQVADIYDPSISIAEQFSELESKFIDFNTGLLMDEYNNFSIDDYDQIIVTKDPNLSSKVPTSEDHPLNPISPYALHKLIGEQYCKLFSKLYGMETVCLRYFNVYGLYGYISIEDDFNTVSGIEFYDHKETPGLGAEVDNPKWKAQWKGKKIYKDNKVNLAVIKGKVEAGDSESTYKIDGLSGATITSRGVTNMVAYWFGESGYSSLLRELDYES